MIEFKKRFICLALALVLIVSVSACIKIEGSGSASGSGSAIRTGGERSSEPEQMDDLATTPAAQEPAEPETM